MQGLCLFYILWRYPSCHYLVFCLCWVARLSISCLVWWGILHWSWSCSDWYPLCDPTISWPLVESSPFTKPKGRNKTQVFQIWPCLPLDRPCQLPLVVTLITKEVFGHCRSCPWAWLKPCCVNTVISLFLWYLWKSNPFFFLPLCCCMWSPCNYINFK